MMLDELRVMWSTEGAAMLRRRARKAENAVGEQASAYADLCRRSGRAWRAAADAFEASWSGSEGLDLVAHVERQREFSERVFGPGRVGVGGSNDGRVAGLLDHIRSELEEIERDPEDLEEWIDVVILALDGAWRTGHGAKEIAAALVAKQTKNEGRTWPDWRTSEPGKRIEHVEPELPHPLHDWVVGPGGVSPGVRLYVVHAGVRRGEPVVGDPFLLAEKRREAMIEAERLRAEVAIGRSVLAVVSDRHRDAVQFSNWISASAVVEFVTTDDGGRWTVPGARRIEWEDESGWEGDGG